MAMLRKWSTLQQKKQRWNQDAEKIAVSFRVKQSDTMLLWGGGFAPASQGEEKKLENKTQPLVLSGWTSWMRALACFTAACANCLQPSRMRWARSRPEQINLAAMGCLSHFINHEGPSNHWCFIETNSIKSKQHWNWNARVKFFSMNVRVMCAQRQLRWR